MAIHRLRQGMRALFAFARPVDLCLAARYCRREQLRCSGGCAAASSCTACNVLRAVLAQGAHTPPDLAVAALLHDVGKTRYPLALWQKTLAVLVRTFAPVRL